MKLAAPLVFVVLTLAAAAITGCLDDPASPNAVPPASTARPAPDAGEAGTRDASPPLDATVSADAAERPFSVIDGRIGAGSVVARSPNFILVSESGGTQTSSSPSFRIEGGRASASKP